MKNPKTCYKHRRLPGEDRLEELDSILEKLPKYTGGHAHDRCPYCAYLKGREDALNELEKRMIASSQDVPIRGDRLFWGASRDEVKNSEWWQPVEGEALDSRFLCYTGELEGYHHPCILTYMFGDYKGKSDVVIKLDYLFDNIDANNEADKADFLYQKLCGDLNFKYNINADVKTEDGKAKWVSLNHSTIVRVFKAYNEHTRKLLVRMQKAPNINEFEEALNEF